MATKVEKLNTDFKISSSSATKVVESYLKQAVSVGTSDVHIEPNKEYVRIRFRIDGILKEVGKEPLALHQTLISRIKVMANLDISEVHEPQEGRFLLREKERDFDIRTSTFPTTYGECAVLRILDRSNILFNLEGLGMNHKQFEQFNELIKKPNGLILVTGPTGSGKTTTLFSILNIINSVEKCICTLEDPVEYRLPLVRQSQIDPERGLTFARGLRSLFRQNPDVIMFGEVRDRETAQIATEAAMTGHLVLTTLHTNNAAGAIIRLLNMKIEPFLITSALICSVAQRLVRKICPFCQEIYHPPKDLLKEIGLEDHINFKRGKGCAKCSFTGYKGRTGIFEILITNEEIESLVLSHPSLEEIVKKARENGMQTLQESGREKVLQGITCVEEVLRVTRKI